MNRDGSILIVALLVMTVLSIIGISAITISIINIKISNHFRSNKEAFYIAEAGIEHAREILRSSTQEENFTNTLLVAAGDNNVLDWDMESSDDVPVAENDFATGHYTVYLMNDRLETEESVTDNNKKVILKSIGVSFTGVQSAIKTTVSKFSFPPLPGTITLLGTGSSFIGSQSTAILLTGNDRKECGSSTEAVFAVSHDDTLNNVQDAINNTGEKTYKTDNINGIVQKITDGDLYKINEEYAIDLNSVESLKRLIMTVSKGADTVVSSSNESTAIDMGTDDNPKIILAEEDFSLTSDGAGMLLVKGTLTITGSVDYNGLIITIGDGVIKVAGGEKKTISGGIIVGNVNTPYAGEDGQLLTSDDKPGAALLDISESEDITIALCSRNASTGISLVPLTTIAFLQEL